MVGYYVFISMIMLQAIDIGLVVYNTVEQTGYISSATSNDSVPHTTTTTPAFNSSTTGWSNWIVPKNPLS